MRFRAPSPAGSEFGSLGSCVHVLRSERDAARDSAEVLLRFCDDGGAAVPVGVAVLDEADGAVDAETRRCSADLSPSGF